MLLKVISNKTMGFDKASVLKLVMSDEKKEHFLYRVAGVIEGSQIGKGRHKRVNAETGEAEDTTWTKFFGDFIALRPDGFKAEATTCFLPGYVSGQFVSMLKDDGLAAVEFTYDIFAIYSSQSATSYEYLAQPVRKEGEERRAAAMMEGLPALPGQPQRAAIQGPTNAPATAIGEAMAQAGGKGKK